VPLGAEDQNLRFNAVEKEESACGHLLIYGPQIIIIIIVIFHPMREKKRKLYFA